MACMTPLKLQIISQKATMQFLKKNNSEKSVDMMVLGFHFLQPLNYFDILRGLSGA